MVIKSDWRWLAACIDCDGHVSLYRYLDETHSAIKPLLQFDSKSLKFINIFQKILGLGEVKSWVGKNGILYYRIGLRVYEELNVVLPKLIPHLILKREAAEIVLEYVKLRLSRGKRSRYGEQEFILLKRSEKEKKQRYRDV